MHERLQRLIARREAAAKARDEILAKRQAIVDLAEEEAREDLSVEEDTEFRTLSDEVKAKDEEIRSFDERIAELAEEIERGKVVTEGDAALRRAQARVKVVSEARTYEKGNGNSYLADIARLGLNQATEEVRGRLERHATEVRTDPEYRALDRTDGTGGYFVPPAWLMSKWVELARAGRPYANLVTNEELPPGTDSINIPKVATGTAVTVQDGDNTAVTSVDLTDTSVNAPVRTIAGQQDVAVQLLDQSPVNFDEVIFRDLLADHATKTNVQVISGTGSNGQVWGVRNTTSIETVTASTTSVGSVYSKIADAVQRVHTLRFAPPSVIVMHPRRWGWFLAATDDDGRPLVLPARNQPSNATGLLTAVASEQVVGEMHGLPVVTDPSLPTTLGDGTNEDVIHVLRASDLLLWESGIRTRVLPEVGSGTLSVRLQVYNYLAFTAARYPKSVVEIGGAGLITPSF
jgi:HK97 family phage major capsid protein